MTDKQTDVLGQSSVCEGWSSDPQMLGWYSSPSVRIGSHLLGDDFCRSLPTAGLYVPGKGRED